MRILINEQLNSVKPVQYPYTKVGYHGSTAVFDKFRNNIAFFSRGPEFAAAYIEDKAMYSQQDADLYVYKCDISNVRFFNASDESHIKKLMAVLPENVTIYTLYAKGSLSRTDLIEELQGIRTSYPIEERYWKGKGVGESFYYDGSSKVIIEITDDILKVMEATDIEWIIEYSGSIDKNKDATFTIGRRYGKFKNDVFKNVNDFQAHMAEKYNDKYGKGHYFYDMEEEEKKHLKLLRKNAIAELLRRLKTDSDFRKMEYVLKPFKMNSTSNYQIFESIIEYISKAGFEGHISMEAYNGEQDFTYAVYRAGKIKILDRALYRS